MEQTIVIVLSIAVVAICLVITNVVNEKCTALTNIVEGMVVFWLIYEIASVILISFDGYSINKSLILSVVLGTLILLYLCVWKKKSCSKISFNIKDTIVTICVIVLACLLALPQSGLCGLWRDDGGYQFRALEYINNNNGNVVELVVNENLPEQEYEQYLKGVQNGLRYLWISENVQSGEEVQVGEEAWFSRIYHNIPTFPAFMALTGMIFGYTHMQYCQILFWILVVLLVYLILEKNRVSTILEIFAIEILLFSPQMIFQSQTALCEIYSMMMIMVFVYGLMDNQKTCWAGIAVCGLSFYHVSIYAVLPVLIICMWIKYIVSGELQVLKQVNWSLLGYVAGYIYMCSYNKLYVLSNYSSLFEIFFGKELDKQKVDFIIALAVLLVTLVNSVLRRVEYKNITNIANKINLQQIVACGYFLVGIICVKRGIRIQADIAEANAVGRSYVNIIYVMFSTGIVLIPISILLSIFERKSSNKNIVWLNIFVIYTVFIYCLSMTFASLQYYFSRYIFVYMFVIVILACLEINEFLIRHRINDKVCLLFLVFGLVWVPADNFLTKSKVDTIISWEAYEKIINSMNIEKSAVMINADSRNYDQYIFMGFHAFGIDAYYINSTSEIKDQMVNLENAGYENVYFFTEVADSNLTTVCEVEEKYNYSALHFPKSSNIVKVPIEGYECDRTIYLQRVSD